MLVLQAIEWFNLGFGATGGGFASVFLGFTAVVRGLLARRRVLDRDAVGAVASPARPAAGEVRAPSAVLRPAADGCVVYLYVMGVIELFAFVLLYLVK